MESYKNNIIIIFFIAFIFLIFPKFIFAAVFIDRDTILENDINGPVFISSSNVVLDCSGHKIIGEGFVGNTEEAVIQIVNLNNIKIKNCIISEDLDGKLTRGIFITNSSNIIIENNKIEALIDAINVYYSHNINILNNTLKDPNLKRGEFYSRGILLFISSDNIIEKNNISFERGIEILGENNQILDNLIYGFGIMGGGITITRPSPDILDSNNIVSGNIISQHAGGLNFGNSSNNKIFNNIIKNNQVSGIRLNGDSNKNLIFNNTITENRMGLRFYGETPYGGTPGFPINNFIYHNNIYSNYYFNVYTTQISQPIELSYENKGNYWGHNSPPCFYRYGGINWPYDSNLTIVVDNHSFCQQNSWLIPLVNFWSEIRNSLVGWLNFRKTPGIQNKPADDIIKTLPNGWAVKVASTTDESDNFIDLDGYRWYKVEDVADGAIGWMAAKNLTDGAVYLDYDFNSQSILEQKAAAQLDTSDKRKPVILQAVDNYYIASTTNSLYSPTGGFDGNNNFQKFIQGANFVKEFVLAIASEESGPNFNNEICSGVLDGGIGIMQITSLGFKGLGSGLRNNPKLNDCNKNTDGWTGNSSKYYSNVFQGIYANIKDGFRVLQEKYRNQCYEEASGGLYFTCDDIRRILTIWGYNGFGDESGTYLNKIAAKLETLSNYFSGVVYSNTDQFIQKLRKVDRQKILALLKSPGELQVEDKNGNITGVVGNTIQENIPNSLYEKDYKGIAIFFPKNPYIYRIIGTASGVYGLDVDFFNEDIIQFFRAKDISITLGEIHEYRIDWSALLNGEAGIFVEIDQNGDKIADKNFVAGETFDQTDIFLQNNTVVDFEPNVLNLESNGIATAYIELPIGYSVNDISTSSIRLNKVVHALSKPIEIGDYDRDGIPDLMVKFGREKIRPTVAVGEKIPITITGKILYGGNYYHFKGQDFIKVISNNKAGNIPNSTVSQWALVQRIFDDLIREKVIVVFYKILGIFYEISERIFAAKQLADK